MPSWDQCRRGFAWVNRLPAPVVVHLATLGPVGHWGRAPGTNGSVVGLLYYWLVFSGGVFPAPSPAAAALLVLATLYLAIVFCDAAEIRLGLRDPGFVILDEVVVIPLCFPGVLPAAAARGWPLWAVLLAGFALFRFFDILKPLGIKKLQDLPGGLGVVVDDIAAALATCAVLNVIVRLF
jgi:phosphatidylglycerophosphatase A